VTRSVKTATFFRQPKAFKGLSSNDIKKRGRVESPLDPSENLIINSLHVLDGTGGRSSSDTSRTAGPSPMRFSLSGSFPGLNNLSLLPRPPRPAGIPAKISNHLKRLLGDVLCDCCDKLLSRREFEVLLVLSVRHTQSVEHLARIVDEGNFVLGKALRMMYRARASWPSWSSLTIRLPLYTLKPLCRHPTSLRIRTSSIFPLI
jgi:hypothetical protein